MDRAGTGLLFISLFCASTGVMCQNMVNLAPGKRYSQISAYLTYNSSQNAANGNTGGELSASNCIHTGGDGDGFPVPGDEFHWWEVDLGRTYPVHNITLWARDEFLHRLYPCNVTVDGQLCATVTSLEREKSLTCSSVMYGRRVRVTLTTKGMQNIMLNLCECQIYVPSGVIQCPAGRWGGQCDRDCSDHCGQGPGNNFCHQDTGVCYDGCAGNFAGDTCAGCRGNFAGHTCTACVAGYFGSTCTQVCDSHCDDTGCDRQNGWCAACDDGFWGPWFCRQPCPSNCAGTACQRDNGHCYTCRDKMYGQNCSESCGHCQGGQPCDPETGGCTGGCQPGYTGSLCKQQCKPGSYGEGCKQTCGQCQVNTTCHHWTGHCPEGCEGDVIAPLCLENSAVSGGQKDGGSDLVIPVVGAIVGGFVLMTVSITAAICWRRRSESPMNPASEYPVVSVPSTTAREPDPTLMRQSAVSVDTAHSGTRQSDGNYEIPDVISTYDKLSPYANDDADREPYMQMTSRVHDVKMATSAF